MDMHENKVTAETSQRKTVSSTKLKKNRSKRKDGGAKGWATASSEILWPTEEEILRDSFPVRALVWGKYGGRYWWPAQVVKEEELPEGLNRQTKNGSICVRFLGVSKESGVQNFAYLKSGEVLPYAKHQEEFAKQGVVATLNIQEVVLSVNCKWVDKQLDITVKLTFAMCKELRHYD